MRKDCVLHILPILLLLPPNTYAHAHTCAHSCSTAHHSRAHSHRLLKLSSNGHYPDESPHSFVELSRPYQDMLLGCTTRVKPYLLQASSMPTTPRILPLFIPPNLLTFSGQPLTIYIQLAIRSLLHSFYPSQHSVRIHAFATLFLPLSPYIQPSQSPAAFIESHAPA